MVQQHFTINISNSSLYVYNNPPIQNSYEEQNWEDVNNRTANEPNIQTSNESNVRTNEPNAQADQFNQPVQNQGARSNAYVLPSQLLTPTALRESRESREPIEPNMNDLDSSGIRTDLSNEFANIIQSLFQIPPESFQIEVLNTMNESRNQGVPISRLFSNTELILPDERILAGDSCPICHNNFEDGEIIRRINSCHHYFHAGCIERWLTTNDTCPVCRGHL